MCKILKLIVAGSRTITDKDFVYSVINEHINYLKSCNHLDEYANLSDLIIVSGCAKGVDTLALNWAEDNNVKYEEYPAKWINERGLRDLSAGFKRNKQMALNSTHLLAIWDGKSNGTSHMIEMMESLNKHVMIVKF